MDIINEYLKKNTKIIDIGFGPMPECPTPRIECFDGYSVSVQASVYAYCEPRETACWPYTSVELGFPTESDILIDEYAEDPDNLTETVYGRVPIEIVIDLINKHGGIV